MGRNADPGRREGLLPSRALGYLLTPLQGFQIEAAASLPLHFLKNVQSQASMIMLLQFSGKPES